MARIAWDRLEHLRLRSEMSWTAIARLAGISPSSITRWRAGERVPDATSILRLADFFGVSLDYLYGRPSRNELSVSPAERSLIDSYRANSAVRRAIDAILELAE